MRQFTLAFLLFIVLLVCYWAWPFIGLRELAVAVEARNGAALSEQVDFARLRSSLAQQIVAAYLRVTGRESKLGALTPFVTAAGASLVDPWLSQIVTPENLVELLRGGKIQSELGEVSFNIGRLPHFSLTSAWNAWLGSEYGIGVFRFGCLSMPKRLNNSAFECSCYSDVGKLPHSNCPRNCATSSLEN